MLRIVAAAVFILFVLLMFFYVSFTTVAPVLYPQRIDSNYVMQNNQNLIAQTNNDTIINPLQLLYSPAQMNVGYKEIKCVSNNNVLHGWFYNRPKNPNSTALLLIHNIGESKISLMESCRLFSELGFYVFCFDMPSHGNSTGEVYSMDAETINSLKIIVDSIYCYPQINNLVLAGIGFNALVAAKLAEKVKPDVLILQEPVNSVNDYLKNISKSRWGRFAPLVIPFARYIYSYKTGVPSDSLILSAQIKSITMPLMIAVTNNSVLQNEVTDAVLIYQNSNAAVKKLWTDKSKGFITNNEDEEKNYYRAVAAFINSNIPKETITKRKRKSLVVL